ncbi:Hypothetical_protein [Hexamita inflata]|uniref:Hypothetical_protein n=1 Tax=Hexamita inflata TaxID=28002 RepID=A0AA86RSP2_9EUKA|nr:Hypothetical protein HINF_LOCUS66608 [Hexamita inflata]
MQNAFTMENSRLLNDLQYASYLMVRNSVTKHSTKALVERSKLKPTKSQYNALKHFFRSGLTQAADFIHDQLLSDIENLADAAPMIEFLNLLSAYEKQEGNLKEQIRLKTTENQQLDNTNELLEEEIKQLRLENMELEANLKNELTM